MEKFLLGKNGDFGSIDFAKIKSGIKKEDIVKDNNQALKSLFELIDQNSDNVLDRNEINQLQQKIQNLDKNNDGQISKKEIKGLKDKYGEKLDRKTRKEFFAFLSKLVSNSAAQEVQNVVDTNNDSEIVTYEDGTTEEIFDDGKRVITQEKNGAKTVTEKAKNGDVIKETYNDEKTSKITTYKNGQKLEIIKDKEANTTEKYINGKLVEKESRNTKTKYTEEGSTSITTNGNTKITVRKNKNDEIYNSELQEKLEDGRTKKTETNYQGKNFTQNVTIDGKNVSQTKKIDGKTYNAKYDGDGNTIVVLQYGESINALAKKFGCSIRDLINANKNLGTFELAGEIFFCVKGKKQAFETSFSEEPMYIPISVYGEEIKIPKKLEADDSALQNRLDSEGVKKEIEQAKIENQKIIARLKAADEANTKRKEAEQKARQKKEEHDARVSNATMIALDFYEIADEYSSNNSLLKMKELLTNKVNKDNIMYFLEAYSNPNVRKGDSSVIDTVLSEYGAPVYKRQVLTLIWNALVAKARDAKVSENNISSLTAKFNKELDEVDFTPSSPTQLEIHLDALYKLILAAEQNVENVNEDEAMQKVAQGFDKVNDNATKEFETAREEEGWVAVTGDWICGLFGCNTIDEMRAKLGENADKVAKLAEAANKKDKTTFKKIYKELFGIDFDPKVVAAYSKHQEKLGQVIALDESIKIIDKISEQAKNLDYTALVEMIKEKFGYDDATIATIIEEFADSHVMSASNEENKKNILIAFLEETRQEINTKMLNLSGGKSIKDLEKESEKLSTAAYGTNDIGKMVAEFNKNMVYTEMGAQIGLEIAGTIVLQFVPGLGQAAAAAMAARLANWGYKGVKIAKCLTSLSKGLATVKKVQQGAATGSKIANKVSQVAMASVNAGMATAAVNLSDGKDVKTTLHRTLMNMAFAGAGMTSNILAPKLMQAFGVSKQIAIECAEEIINAAAAYGITTIQGENYGSQDAFLDFVTGLLMARFSHIKPVSKVKAQASNADNTVSGTKRTSDTNYTESSSNNSRVENNTNTNTKTETENKTSAQPEAGAETSNKKTSADTGAEAPKNKKSENISGEENVNRQKTQETQETKTSTKERIKAEAERVKQKYGKKIARTYAAILRGIESMKTSVDFNKISKKIKEKFANYADLSKELMEKLKTKAKELKMKLKGVFDNNSGTKKAGEYSNINPKYRKTSNEINNNEFVRNNGNNGKPINEKYVKASRDLRNYYNEAIASGKYTGSYEDYVKTITEAHRIAANGKDGSCAGWYGEAGQGGIDVNPGKIRGNGYMVSNRVKEGQIIEEIAIKYGDPYSTKGSSQVKLPGISDAAQPRNIGTQHFYPDGKYLDEYFKQMHRTAKEALELIEKGAPQDKILAKLAEHYQYAANARPFGQINNSLFMNEINTLLQKAGMKTIPHGMLDHAAQRLQPEAFKKYFIDEYKRTALDSPTANTNNSQKTDSSQRTENSQSRQSQYRHSQDEWNAYSRFNKHQQPIEFPKKGRLNPDAQYILNENDLPKLYFYGENEPIIIDFNSPSARNVLTNLKEGEFITLGRQGTFVISDDPMISRHHILITRQNGKLQIKDLSKNGTYCSPKERSYHNENSYSNYNNYRSKNSSKSSNSARKLKPSRKYNTGKNTYTDKFIADTEYFLNRIQKASDVSKLKNTELKELADVIGISIDDLKTLSSKNSNGKASTEAKKVYRKLAVKFHPDKTGSDEVAEMIFKLIANIYNI